ncbi:MAG: bifunctional UDP-N-acetylmuramoyl-tripeptide:D-alanyl-D-alanine ligase/alanine racemase [Saprospiraceae bacterium]
MTGELRNGHQFISDAIEKGVKVIVYSEEINLIENNDIVFLKVKNTIDALQEIAAYHRSKFDIPIVGITGSNGKTIVKDWLSFLISSEFKVVKSPGSFNSQIGVPLSIWKIDKTDDIGVFEAGISASGEMIKLQKIIRPTIGIFTNIGDAHNSGFKDKGSKLEEKILLFESCNKVICCHDDDNVMEALRRKYGEGNILSFSFKSNNNAELKITAIENNNVKFNFDGKNHDIKVPFSDIVSIRMIFATYLGAISLGANHDRVIERIESLTYPRMRMEMEKGINDCSIINDTYNSDIESIQNSINFLAYLGNGKKNTLIITDFYGLKENENDIFASLKLIISKANFSKIILIGDEIIKLADYISGDITSYKYSDTSSFLQDIDNISFYKENILLKGSRKFELERVFRKLAENLHTTQLIIDFEALNNNISQYRSILSKTTKIMAVIKASGYGSGAIKMAEQLQKTGIDYLSVAFFNEAMELRKAGINLPIMVFNPDLNYLDEMIKYDIEPVVYSKLQLQYLEEYNYNSLKIHIKLDTGMKRLGFEQDEIDSLCNWLKERPEIKIMSVFSHLAASEEPDKDTFTEFQIKNFNNYFKKIATTIGYYPIKHILNSSGIVRFPQYQFDMVRLGSGMHGIDISDIISDKLEAVNTLQTKINQIKILKSGEGMGYGIKYKIDKERKIAIIPIGYADGIPRLAGNGNYHVFVNGTFVPIVANINMDMTFLDVSDVADVKIGDNVEVFGKNAKITDLAIAGQTIFYEILSKISTRIKRVYSI